MPSTLWVQDRGSLPLTRKSYYCARNDTITTNPTSLVTHKETDRGKGYWEVSPDPPPKCESQAPYLKNDEYQKEHKNNEQKAAGVQCQKVIFVGEIRLLKHKHTMTTPLWHCASDNLKNILKTWQKATKSEVTDYFKFTHRNY